ncbi:PHP domain-containing protein [soil metagenome]
MTGERAVDLHTHSSASDGLFPPRQLVREAHAVGLSAIGLTDHDTTAGLDDAEAEATSLGLFVVPGVELSATDSGREAHTLGYFIDRDNEPFQVALRDFVTQRSERIDRMIARLQELGVPIDRDAVLTRAGVGTVGRPHVAWELIEMGAADDMVDAFDRYLGTGKPAYIPRPRLTPERAIEIIRSAGGAPVLAHPLSSPDPETLIARLAQNGLVGMEVTYGEYDQEQRDRLRRIADANDLIPTGGSDFHAHNFKPGRDLGATSVPWETIERLKTASDRIRSTR